MRDTGVVLVLLVLAVLGDSVARSLVDELDGAVPLTDVLVLAVVIVPLLVRRRYPPRRSCRNHCRLSCGEDR
ncbi:hypothetical protein BH23ACT5_BH23ACT5_18670 [soil metagenome]